MPYVAEATGDTKNQVIYTSGDGLFKFAYIRGGTGAVILDYNDLGNNPEVTIPATLEAYRSYSENYQGVEYYCLVSANDELMGYKLRDQPLVEESTGRPYYRTTDRSPNGIDIENIEKITDIRQDDKGFYILFMKLLKQGQLVNQCWVREFIRVIITKGKIGVQNLKMNYIIILKTGRIKTIIHSGWKQEKISHIGG